MDGNCWICHGDCAGANPPMAYCPMRDGKPDLCIDCDGNGKYPAGHTCRSCGGSGKVLPGDGIKVPAVQ